MTIEKSQKGSSCPSSLAGLGENAEGVVPALLLVLLGDRSKIRGYTGGGCDPQSLELGCLHHIQRLALVPLGALLRLCGTEAAVTHQKRIKTLNGDAEHEPDRSPSFVNAV